MLGPETFKAGLTQDQLTLGPETSRAGPTPARLLWRAVAAATPRSRYRATPQLPSPWPGLQPASLTLWTQLD